MQEPVFKGHAILLTGQIGLQFFLELPAGKTAADYPNSYVTFAGNKINSATQHPLPASTAVINGQDIGRYEFVVNMSSIQMADKFTPTLHRVLSVKPDGYVICGDNRWGREYGITDRHVIGVLTAVIRDGREIPVTNWRCLLYAHLWCDLFPGRALILRIRHVLKRLTSRHRSTKA